ncbi:sensor histidine kinase [Vibrio rhizosphaerae]|uniref:histidine kinase n=1 Tax=Vibrio rhizosphaerae TaxID=398736 RepID=A0ABU4ITI7_9VIBR|nr:sensor histidine kinase [Vibrio rhizosphaerae]MDW6092695.1 sensor histidine kinase [Vibrio rhizosphaerae]
MTYLSKRSYYFKLVVTINIICFVGLVLVALNLYNRNFTENLHQLKNYGLSQARVIAHDPLLSEQVFKKNIGQLSAMAQKYQWGGEIEYISISNTQGIRLFHSKGYGIGEKIHSNKIDEIAQGKEISDVSQGFYGRVLVKARVPIFYHGQFIGIVSTGISYPKFIEKQKKDLNEMAMLFIAAWFINLGVSYLLIRSLRYRLNLMTPEQIEKGFVYRQYILDSVYEGIVAVNKDDHVVLINDAAMAYLDILDEDIRGKPIADYIFNTDFFSSQSLEELKDETILCNGHSLIATRKPIYDKQGNELGLVVSFRINTMKDELENKMNQFAKDKDNLRAIIHEFNNQMSVIYGLLEMKRYDSVLQYIDTEFATRQNDVREISKMLPVPDLAAMFLSKKVRAKELNISLEIDPMSRIDSKLLPINIQDVTCIIGNLISNAFEAVVSSHAAQRVVSVYVYQSDEFIIEVADSGGGVAEEDADKIFERGVTSKAGDNHGIGLHLVKTLVEQADGRIVIEESDFGGALFMVFIPLNIGSISSQSTYSEIHSLTDA